MNCIHTLNKSHHRSIDHEGAIVAKFQQDPTFALYCRNRLHRGKLEKQMGWLLRHSDTDL